jgi:hypothetical protein
MMIKIPLLNFFFFFCSTGVWTQSLHLEPLHQSFFVMGSFEIKPSWLRTEIFLISASLVARISHQSLAELLFHNRLPSPSQPAWFNAHIGSHCPIVQMRTLRLRDRCRHLPQLARQCENATLGDLTSPPSAPIEVCSGCVAPKGLPKILPQGSPWHYFSFNLIILWNIKKTITCTT